MTIQIPSYLRKKTYAARWDRWFLADVFGAGVKTQTDLAVSSTGAALGTSVARGVSYVVGSVNTDQGTYRFFNDTAYGFVHDAAVTNPRWDRIIARIYDSDELGSGSDLGTLEIVKGTENAGAALANAVGSELGIGSLAAIYNYYEIARILVPVGAGPVIPGGNIRDMRTISPLAALSLISSIVDTYANRGNYNVAMLPNGFRFFASDKAMEWTAFAGAWVLTSVMAPEVVALPTSPVDQQECTYIADSTNGVKWRLKYRSASGSAYKWEFVGGSPLQSTVDTSEAFASGTSYAPLTTAGPSVTVPLAGDFDVEVGSVPVLAATITVYHSFTVGAAAALDADAASFAGGASTLAAVSKRRRKTGLVASTALVSQYKQGFSSTTAWRERRLVVTPVRVG